MGAIEAIFILLLAACVLALFLGFFQTLVRRGSRTWRLLDGLLGLSVGIVALCGVAVIALMFKRNQ